MGPAISMKQPLPVIIILFFKQWRNHFLYVVTGRCQFANLCKRRDSWGTAQENADILLSVLKGKKSAYYDTVLLNAGLGIFASGKVNSIQDGIEKARESIESGAALKRLEYLIDYSKKVPSGVS